MAERKWRDTTRDGTPVRIYAQDGAGHYPIHGAIKKEKGWLKADWDEGGNYHYKGAHDGLDLIPLREPSAEAVEAVLANLATQELVRLAAFSSSAARTTIAAMLRAAYAIDGIEPAGK